jgi:hypothetical protein
VTDGRDRESKYWFATIDQHSAGEQGTKTCRQCYEKDSVHIASGNTGFTIT